MDMIVSICIPAFNAERFLAETLESVRSQTYVDWELIVTEDGSHDHTRSIVADFASTVSQPVRYTRHDPNMGLSATRNAGIKLASGNWIALLDSDDLWEPEHLANCLETATSTGADLVHAGSLLFDSVSGRQIEHLSPTPEMLSSLPSSVFAGIYRIQPSSVLLHRNLSHRVGGFDTTLRYGEDLDMWLRCLRAGARLAFTGHETLLYRKHATSLSTHSPAMAEGVARVFDKHLDWLEIPASLRKQSCSIAWADAARLTWRSDPKTAAKYFRRACLVKWSLRWWMQGQVCRLLQFRDRLPS